jgi:hypothetical protein
VRRRLDTGEILAHVSDGLVVAQAVAAHEGAAADAESKDETVGVEFGQGARRRRSGDRLPLPDVGDRGANDNPGGGAEQMGSERKGVAPEGFGNPQDAIAEAFDLAGKGEQLAALHGVSIRHQTESAQIHRDLRPRVCDNRDVGQRAHL